MKPISDYEVMTRPLRADRSMADDLTGTNVFVPGLMGAGILMSAGILVSDGLRKLFPSSGTRRGIKVTRGVQRVVAGVAAAAGVTIEERNLLRRGPRRVAFYLSGAILLAALAVAAMTLGIVAFNGDGVLEGNAISVVAGSVAAVIAGGLAIAFAILGAVRNHRVPIVSFLMETTSLGRLQPPPESRLERARLLIPYSSDGEIT